MSSSRPRLQLQQRTTVKVTSSLRQRTMIAGSVVAVSALAAAALFLLGSLSNDDAHANTGTNMGFEAGMNEWTQVSGSWNINTNAAHVRTGNQSTVVEVFTSDVEVRNSDAQVQAINKVIVTAWAKATNTNGRIRVGVMNTANNTKTMASSYVSLTTNGFTQVTAIFNVTNGATYVPVIQTRRATSTVSYVYVDDVHIYTNTGNIDATQPSPASAVTAVTNGNQINVSWTNGTDNGVGIDGVTVLRKSGADATAVTLQDNAVYHPTNSTIGATSVSGYNVVYNGSASSFTDNPGSTGTFTYLVFMRDKAFNYSALPARMIVVNGNGVSTNLTSAVELDGLEIPSSATLNITATGSLAARAGAELNIHGTLQNAGSVTNTAGGAVNFKSGALYRHAQNGGSIVTATWESGSTCEITGVTTTTPTGLNQSFHHFTWNSTGQTAAQTLPDGFAAIGNATFQHSGTSATGRIVNVSGVASFSGNLLCSNNSELRFNSNSNAQFNGTSTQAVQSNGAAFAFGTVTIDNAAGVTLSSPVSVQTGCVLSAGNLNLNGHTLGMANNATLTRSNGSVSNGTVAPVSGRYNVTYTATLTTALELPADADRLGSLTLNANNITVTLDKHAYVNTTLNLTKGQLHTGGFEVFVQNASTNAVTYGNNDYVVGRIRRSVNGSGTYNFPVGSPGNRQFVSLVLNNLVGVSNIYAEFKTSVTGTQPNPQNLNVNGNPINALLNCGIWSVEPDQQPTAGNYDITIQPKGFTNGVASVLGMALIKRNNASSPWQSVGTHNPLANTLGGGLATLKRFGLTSFSDFGGGFGSGAVLPITLSAFDAQPDNGRVRITWSTSAELNNAFFSLERSANGSDFETINEQEGAGTSTVAHHYAFIDEHPIAGTGYYRIKQTDFDGTFTYSPVKAVSLTGSTKPSPLGDVSVYPNPSNGVFYFGGLQSAGGEARVTVSVYNIKGQLVLQQTVETGGTPRIDLTGQPPGVYVATVSDADNQTVSVRLTKTQ